MSDIKAGDIYRLNDGLEPPVEIEIEAVHDTGLVQTIVHIKRTPAPTKRKGGQNIESLQQFIENEKLIKIKTNKGGN